MDVHVAGALGLVHVDAITAGVHRRLYHTRTFCKDDPFRPTRGDVAAVQLNSLAVDAKGSARRVRVAECCSLVDASRIDRRVCVLPRPQRVLAAWCRCTSATRRGKWQVQQQQTAEQQRWGRRHVVRCCRTAVVAAAVAVMVAAPLTRMREADGGDRVGAGGRALLESRGALQKYAACIRKCMRACRRTRRAGS